MAWLMLGALVLFSLIRLPAVMPTVPSGDKWLHLISYLGLSYWFLHAYAAQPVKVMSGLMLLGAVLELLQSLTPYRHMEWLDLLMNVLGVGIATSLFCSLKLQVSWLRVNTDKK